MARRRFKLPDGTTFDEVLRACVHLEPKTIKRLRLEREKRKRKTLNPKRPSKSK